MESSIAKALKLTSEPVAIVWSDQPPADAGQFEQGRWGCVMSMFAACATKGKAATFSKETYGCVGGGFGLGFGNTYTTFPGGIPGFCRFLSTGNEEDPAGRQIGEGMKQAGARAEFVEHFLHGERYKQNPELVRAFVDALPAVQVPTKYVSFVQLKNIDPAAAAPISVTFLVNPDQLAALVVLANYDRPGLENTAIPYVAGCQSIGILGYRERESKNPRGIVGMVDLSARRYMRGVAGRNSFTFTLPFARFQEMEKNVEGSFLQGEVWQALSE